MARVSPSFGWERECQAGEDGGRSRDGVTFKECMCLEAFPASYLLTKRASSPF